jgi:glucan-binding YG repeat protein
MQTESRTQLVPGIRLLALVLLSSLFMAFCAVSAGAATKNGFVTENGKTYYYENGKKHTGWLTLGNRKYYFTKSAGVMATGWLTDSKGNKRYFDKSTGVMATGWVSYSGDNKRYFSTKNGVMATGWLKVNSDRFYMDPSTGYALKGFQKIGSYYRYFYSKSGALARGWLTNSAGEKRYFSTSSSNKTDGAMNTGFSEIDGKTYYFKTNNGKMVTGWKSINGNRYYFQEDGSMATGTVNIGGTEYIFSDTGAYISGSGADGGEIGNLSVSTGEKTIKNYLLGALMPVGKVLYIWGGGWNDANLIGLSSKWTDWYKSQKSSYDYQKYSDLTAANRAKGLDCSGFVGWAAYQVMHKTTGEHYGYTVVSGEVGGYYSGTLGWGTTMNQNYLSSKGYTLKAGDIGYNSGHVWIVLGQCKDKSVVIVHSTPNAGVQISGTATPKGDSNSEAVALARKYMSRYPGTQKYKYNYSVGNYIPRYNYFRWNRQTLADPDGYMSMYADQILADLFAS